MITPLFDRIAILGVGLLGGSMGLAAKERKLCREVVGVGRSKASLDEALRIEAIDKGTTDLVRGVADADLIVLCTPVRHIVSILPDIVKAAKPGAIITDVGSTKSSIVSAGEELAASQKKAFVGSHPMAGSEKSGVRHSRADLYTDTTCFVAKTARTEAQAFAIICAFWRALETRIVVMRPERHDNLMGLISHLPHLVAVALVRAVDASGEDKNLIKGIVGNGFRDTTRIAAGNTQMWEDICADNSGEIGKSLLRFRNMLDEIIAASSAGSSGLSTILDEAGESRAFLDNR